MTVTYEISISDEICAATLHFCLAVLQPSLACGADEDRVSTYTGTPGNTGNFLEFS